MTLQHGVTAPVYTNQYYTLIDGRGAIMDFFSRYSQQVSIALVIALILLTLIVVVWIIRTKLSGKKVTYLQYIVTIVLGIIVVAIVALTFFSGNNHPISNPIPFD